MAMGVIRPSGLIGSSYHKITPASFSLGLLAIPRHDARQDVDRVRKNVAHIRKRHGGKGLLFLIDGRAPGGWPMSAFGTKRTSEPPLRMSAFGGKADIVSALSNVCF